MRDLTFRAKISQAFDYNSRTASTVKQVYKYSSLHLSNINVDDYLFARVRAVSADVPNRNGDAFPYEELKKAYLTFQGAGVYCDHKTDSVADMRGVIFDAVFVEDPVNGAWVELLIGIDKQYEDLCNKIRKGVITDVSMGCTVLEGECSICGNICRGKTDEYGRVIDMCEHVEDYKGRTYNGQLVYELCRGVHFIEISCVTDGADPDAIFLDRDFKVLEPNLSVINTSYNIAQFERGLKKVASSTTNNMSTLVRDLPDTIASKLFEDCKKVSSQYWNLFQSIQGLTLTESYQQLQSLQANKLKEIRHSRYSLASVDMVQVEQLAQSYLQDAYVDRNEPSTLNQMTDFILGKILEDPQETSSDQLYEMVRDVAQDVLNRSASKKITAGKLIKDLSDVSEGDLIVVSDRDRLLDEVSSKVLTTSKISGSDRTDFITIQTYHSDGSSKVFTFSNDSLKSGKIDIKFQ